MEVNQNITMANSTLITLASIMAATSVPHGAKYFQPLDLLSLINMEIMVEVKDCLLNEKLEHMDYIDASYSVESLE